MRLGIDKFDFLKQYFNFDMAKIMEPELNYKGPLVKKYFQFKKLMLMFLLFNMINTFIKYIIYLFLGIILEQTL